MTVTDDVLALATMGVMIKIGTFLAVLSHQQHQQQGKYSSDCCVSLSLVFLP
jgi:hypothetical protein